MARTLGVEGEGGGGGGGRAPLSGRAGDNEDGLGVREHTATLMQQLWVASVMLAAAACC